ncbi:MAG: hypothetical protein KF718_01320 [Polyangiaceae bacterium]|nr:hypothetical protein [Polyangiaceae bacterium]
MLEHAHPIAERGFAVFERAWTDAEVERLRAAIVASVESRDGPPLWARENTPLDPRTIVTPTGLTFPSLLEEHPELSDVVLKPSVVESLRGVLGEGMRLELVGAVVSDASRPFFAWHSHIGGVPDSEYRRTGWPRVTKVERVFTLLYLDDVDDQSGVLLVRPRTVGEPTPPPEDPELEAWSEQVELRLARGSLVALEQCTWHAARAMRRDGLRIFVGCYFRAAGLPAPSWSDPTLSAHAPASPLLSSVL